jgi:hypothetical protein
MPGNLAHWLGPFTEHRLWQMTRCFRTERLLGNVIAMPDSLISVILPVFNEAENLRLLIPALFES